MDWIGMLKGKTFQLVIKAAAKRSSLPVQNVQQVTRNCFPVFSNAALVNAPLQRGHQLVPVLLNNESNELLVTNISVFVRAVVQCTM